MPEQISGEPALIQANLPAAFNILSTTNTSPVMVELNSDHGLKPGDYVKILGAAVAAVDGEWMVGTTPASDTLTLRTIPAGTAPSAPGSTGGAAGTLQMLGFGGDNSYTIPVDLTDARDASSVNVAFENLGARSSYLMYGLRTLVEEYASVYDFEQVGGDSAGTFDSFATTSYTNPGTLDVTIPHVAAGDVLVVAFHSSASFADDGHPTHSARLRLTAVEDFGGAATSIPLPGAMAVLVGSQITPVSIGSSHVVLTPGPIKIKLQGKVPDGGAQLLILFDAGTLRVTRFRKIG